jgi:hypothetical protein
VPKADGGVLQVIEAGGDRKDICHPASGDQPGPGPNWLRPHHLRFEAVITESGENESATSRPKKLFLSRPEDPLRP